MADIRRARMLGGDVLNQRSSQPNVHDLDAAANAEDWNTLMQSGVEEINFELIADRINTIRRRVDVVVSVPCWIYVRPTTQKKAVNDRRQFADGITLWRQDNWNAPRGFHGSHVRRRHAIPQECAVGESVKLCRRGYADDRLHSAAVPSLSHCGPYFYQYKE